MPSTPHLLACLPAGANDGTDAALWLKHHVVRSHTALPWLPTACPQEQLAERAQRYGSNTTRPPKEVTFLELVAEALQVCGRWGLTGGVGVGIGRWGGSRRPPSCSWRRQEGVQLPLGLLHEAAL